MTSPLSSSPAGISQNAQPSFDSPLMYAIRWGIHSRMNASGCPPPCWACRSGGRGGALLTLSSSHRRKARTRAPKQPNGSRISLASLSVQPEGETHLSTRGRRTRLFATGATLAVLAYGSINGGEKLFPAGPMSQYAFYVDPDSEVISTNLEADTTAGTHVVVHLSPQGVGIKRASIEGQLTDILTDPSRLRAVAAGQRRLHPNDPQFTRIYVVQDIVPIHDRSIGAHRHKVVATWDAHR